MKIKRITAQMKILGSFSLKSLLLAPFFTACVNQSNLTPTSPPHQESNQTISKESNQTTHVRYNLDEMNKVLSPKKEPVVTTMITLESSDLEPLVTPILEASVNIEEENWIEETPSEEILETAKAFLGVKYVWAANGPSAFDCSGFTKYVFKQNGIDLPRYSGSQATIGEKIDFENLQIGDLVFFDTSKKFKHKVNHVGIYIGEHKFIHASSAKKKVIITSFDKKKFYKNKFLYARRVTQNQNIALNVMPSK